MRQYNLHEARAHLSQLVQAALDGEEVLIARAGKPAVRLVPVSPATHRTSGWGALNIAPEAVDDAFAPEAESAVAALFLGTPAP